MKVRLWQAAKRWRRLSFGPLSLIYRFGRTVAVSSNARRRLSSASSTERRRSLPERRHAPEQAGQPAGSCATPASVETALIVGAGPGLGCALARCLAEAGLHVILVARNAERLDTFVAQLRKDGRAASAYGCDATDEGAVGQLVKQVVAEFGALDLVVYAVQGFSPGTVVESQVDAFEDCWRQNCLGAFIVAREAARQMTLRGRGSIVFTGSTSSLIGRENHLDLAVGKFGTRALAQVLAREVWPLGVHVAHMVIDADIDEGAEGAAAPQADPDDLAQAVLMLHRQPRSAWTCEVDFRPMNESFWQHC